MTGFQINAQASMACPVGYFCSSRGSVFPHTRLLCVLGWLEVNGGPALQAWVLLTSGLFKGQRGMGVHSRSCCHSLLEAVVKNSPASAGGIRDMGLIPGSGRSPGGGHGNPLQCSCLENPMERGAWQASVHGKNHRVRHD